MCQHYYRSSQMFFEIGVLKNFTTGQHTILTTWQWRFCFYLCTALSLKTLPSVFLFCKQAVAERYLRTCQISMMERFWENSSLQLLTIFVKKLYHRYLIVLNNHLSQEYFLEKLFWKFSERVGFSALFNVLDEIWSDETHTWTC